METVAKLSKISRIHLRRRPSAQHLPRGPAIVKHREEQQEKESEELVADTEVDHALLAREKKGREVMGQSHRIFHRRQEPNIVTVVVDVVATVDQHGNIIAQQTLPPALPAVLAVPTVVLPSVPPVPPFPSDLTVPAVPSFPWPSGVPSVVDLPTVPLITSTPVPATTPAIISGIPTSYTNSTISSSALSTIPISSLNSTSSTSGSSSSSQLSTSSTSSSALSTRTSVSSTFSSQTDAPSSTNPAGGRVGGAPESTAPVPAASSPAAGAQNSGSGSSTPTPTVVGSVVGSLAGFALILAIILILIRRHKQKRLGGALQLRDDNDTVDNQPIAASGQQMATTRGSAMPGGAAAFLNRFSGASKSTAGSSATGEKSFQRISGRKLPSAFSEGMTSEQFAREGTLSGSSFYRDDQGFYGGPGAAPNKDFGKDTGGTSAAAVAAAAAAAAERERIMPSPARTPVIHHPDDAPPWGTSRNGGNSTLSPPHTPNAAFPPRSTLGRSHPSHDGSRSSRFTEDV
ncbi:hypothetical protein B0J11DRAFT_178123 [Dendryphion nanum]|uniref:Uncharacterized protein n=1 Tax=Dendryphion nanum TaxID=256645 RepID=A0A9P9EB73_9PLEO|nr:hypothetical protein B0J11DRAFT_178123 [Dendryphion nanum]